MVEDAIFEKIAVNNKLLLYPLIATKERLLSLFCLLSRFSC